MRWFFPELNHAQLQAYGASLPAKVYLPLYVFLPLVGAPISPFLLASGLKYGFWLALAITVVVMAAHTLIAYRLAHGLFRTRLEQWFDNTHYSIPSIPPQHQIWFTTLFVVVPGLPYVLKLYSLALTNLSFRRYTLIVWSMHSLNAIPFIGLGTAAGKLDTRMLILFGVLVVAATGGSWWLKRKFVVPSGDQHSDQANDPNVDHAFAG
jgi:uncharacterized membrane protein YdjX (TVP38/TMEM64 family)